MKTTIDSAGRIVIPRDVRSSAGLGPGTVVEIELRDGVISIEPAPSPVRIVRRGKLRVAMIEGEEERLTEDDVRQVRDSLRKRS